MVLLSLFMCAACTITAGWFVRILAPASRRGVWRGPCAHPLLLLDIESKVHRHLVYLPIFLAHRLLVIPINAIRGSCYKSTSRKNDTTRDTCCFRLIARRDVILRKMGEKNRISSCQLNFVRTTIQQKDLYYEWSSYNGHNSVAFATNEK